MRRPRLFMGSVSVSVLVLLALLVIFVGSHRRQLQLNPSEAGSCFHTIPMMVLAAGFGLAALSVLVACVSHRAAAPVFADICFCSWARASSCCCFCLRRYLLLLMGSCCLYCSRCCVPCSCSHAADWDAAAATAVLLVFCSLCCY